MTRHVLVVRLDGMGDVLLAGPAVRAVAASAGHVTMLVGPDGTAAAELLPGVDEVLTWSCPWVIFDPPAVDPADVAALISRISAAWIDEAVVLTSFHQSPLPIALVLRLAGVAHISAISIDYPGALLDVRHHVDEAIPEPERALSLVHAAGYRLPPGDDTRLRIRGIRHSPVSTSRVVVHPGTSVPARAWPAQRHRATVRQLAASGFDVVVTGGPSETDLTRTVAGDAALDLGGQTSLRRLADVLADADVVVAGNTGPAHLAAAVGTPVVSLFAPTVSARAWAPYGIASIILGDQWAPCRDSRARTCPVDGHPCLASVTPDDVVRAVDALAPQPAQPPRAPTPTAMSEGVHL